MFSVFENRSTATLPHDSRKENREKSDSRIDWLSFTHALSVIITDCMVLTLASLCAKHERVIST